MPNTVAAPSDRNSRQQPQDIVISLFAIGRIAGLTVPKCHDMITLLSTSTPSKGVVQSTIHACSMGDQSMMFALFKLLSHKCTHSTRQTNEHTSAHTHTHTHTPHYTPTKELLFLGRSSHAPSRNLHFSVVCCALLMTLTVQAHATHFKRT